MKRQLTSLLFASAATLGAGASGASAEPMTFSGSCSLSLAGESFVTIDTFNLKAEEGDCPNKSMEFTLPDSQGGTEYGIYVEFQRSEFGENLTDKPYIAYYKKDAGTLKDFTRLFNVKPGTIVNSQKSLPNDARLYCAGEIL